MNQDIHLGKQKSAQKNVKIIIIFWISFLSGQPLYPAINYWFIDLKLFTFFCPVSKTVNLSIILRLSSSPCLYRLILSWLQVLIGVLICSVRWRPCVGSVEWCSRVFSHLKVPSVIRPLILGRFLLFWKSSMIQTAKMIHGLGLKNIMCISAGIRFGLSPIRPYLLRLS